LRQVRLVLPRVCLVGGSVHTLAFGGWRTVEAKAASAVAAANADAAAARAAAASVQDKLDNALIDLQARPTVRSWHEAQATIDRLERQVRPRGVSVPRVTLAVLICGNALRAGRRRR
jgi:hypothetical protein